jgi:hypothetical protein
MHIHSCRTLSIIDLIGYRIRPIESRVIIEQVNLKNRAHIKIKQRTLKK